MSTVSKATPLAPPVAEKNAVASNISWKENVVGYLVGKAAEKVLEKTGQGVNWVVRTWTQNDPETADQRVSCNFFQQRRSFDPQILTLAKERGINRIPLIRCIERDEDWGQCPSLPVSAKRLVEEVLQQKWN